MERPLLQNQVQAGTAPPTGTVAVKVNGVPMDGDGEVVPSNLIEKLAGNSYRCKIVGPGTESGNYIRVNISEAKGLRWWEGAEPAGGITLLDTIRRGPCSWLMFVSCVGFALPAMIHFWKRESVADYLAGISLLCVTVSSTICDTFAVDSAVFDRPPYAKTARATGLSRDEIAAKVQKAGAEPAILANDSLNLLTRVIDRGTCVFITAPCLIHYMFHQRPGLLINLPFILGFAVAWSVCAIDTRIRGEDQCGIRYVKFKHVVEKRYWLHQKLHALWHFLLIFFMCASALYRPKM